MAGGNLKLENYSDREMLHLLNDLAGEDGWVDVEILAERVGLVANGMSEAQLAIHSRRCISGRLSWIRKLSGTVERHPDKSSLFWRLTVSGQEIVQARLSQALVTGLDQIADANSLLALDALSRRFRRADVKAANLMRREWMYGTHRNRRR
jgi:hypothetical protein